MTTTNKMKRAAIYLRVSTATQTTANQLLELQKVADQRGWQIVEVYEDHGISGFKGRNARPAFDKLCNDAARGRFSVVMAWSVCRLGRSMNDLLAFMNEMREQNVDLYLHLQSVDSSTPAGKAMVAMASVFAEFERSLIVQRVNAGLARAREQGKRLGRPPVPADVERAIQQKRSEGLGINRIARELRVGNSVVQRVVADCG